MKFYRKFLVISSLSVLIIAALAATKPAADHTFKNLKVLPKNISEKALDSIMHDISRDLGVKCNFCHVRTEDRKWDFASDKKGEKEIARDMMRMTIKINKKFFHVKKPAIGDNVSVVTCFTCHHGNAHIEDRK